MKARSRTNVAILLCLLTAAAPARAQQAENTTSPVQNDTVGSPQLRNFSLPGTVTRPQPAPAQQAPTPQQQQPERTVPPPRAGRTATDQAPRQATTHRQQREAAPAAEKPVAQAPPQLPAPSTYEPVPQDNPAPAPTPVPAPAAAEVAQTSSSIPMWPWIVAALALAGAVGWFFLRQRRRESFATAGAGFDLLDSAAAAETPQPAPPPPPPQPAPPATPAQPAAPTGIVSTRLRPTLELEVELGRAIVDEKKAAVEFQLSIFNSGSIAARHVRVEASLFNSGPHQDTQIQAFFDAPLGEGDPIDAITPMQRISISSAVILPRDQVQAIHFQGRQLFVPLIAFNAVYQWPGGRSGQTSASYLIGKRTDGEKLAPLRLDLGPRLFRNLETREHELRMHK